MEAHGVEVRKINMLRGPNIYAYLPVMQVVLDVGPYEDRPSTAYPGGCIERLRNPILQEVRVPVPEGHTGDSADDAWAAAEEVGGTVVVIVDGVDEALTVVQRLTGDATCANRSGTRGGAW